MTTNARGEWRDLRIGFDDALARLPEALKSEGFGIITQIDMKQTMKEKLGVDFRRYRILGACNPKLAHEAITKEPRIGLLLPCNVVLYEKDDGAAVLGIIDPMQQLGDAQGFGDVAREVAERLGRVAGKVDA